MKLHTLNTPMKTATDQEREYHQHPRGTMTPFWLLPPQQQPLWLVNFI